MERCDQIVLPELLHTNALQLAHDVPMAGHMGRQRTLDRLRKRFWWPGITRDVDEYCKSCPECQKVTRKGARAPLVSMPIIEQPFQRIAMDIIGPLPKTASGHQYALVICDYATRYPAAYPLRTVTAPKVAEKLMDFFSLHGIPKEILTDQGTNFTSALLGELYESLGVKGITTSPYHPQTDGMVERFNQTLKLMLRKTTESSRRGWDKLLPLVLFAFREIPQETTGFSPFELTSTHDVRGPMDVLKEAWMSTNKPPNDIATYVMDIREKMKETMELVRASIERAQQRQKSWYDQNAREANYQEGESVLLLLPDSTHKFQRRWRGPYRVLRKVGAVNYEISMGPEQRTKIFHINLLRKWYPRAPEQSSYVNDVEEFESFTECGNPTLQIKMGTQLTDKQQEQLRNTLHCSGVAS